MSIDRLRAHWGFSKTPFTKELQTSMLFASAAHQEAVARIGWIITERALGVVCGEVGAGKTVAARAASAALDASRHTIIYLPNPAVGARGIYTQIVSALGATPRFYRATLIPQATDLLAAESSERGKTVVLVLDEAHLLSVEQLEELRMLTNSEMDSRATFACLLLGQPTLRRRLRQGVFAALDQRIALRCTIDGMDLKETGEYIAHHVKLAGRSDTIFSDDAVALIHEASRGLPRQVNNLATQSLIAAYATNKSICDESAARAAVVEISAELPARSSPYSMPVSRRRTRQPANPKRWRSRRRPVGPHHPTRPPITGSQARSLRRSRRTPRPIPSRSSPSCSSRVAPWSAAALTSKSKRPCTTPTSSRSSSVTQARQGRAARSITSPS